MPYAKDSWERSVKLYATVEEAKAAFTEANGRQSSDSHVSLVVAKDGEGREWFAVLETGRGGNCFWEHLDDWNDWFDPEWKTVVAA